MIIDEMKKKNCCEYSFCEVFLSVSLAVCAVLCIFFDVLVFLWAIVVGSAYVALLIIPISLLGVIAFSVLMYTDFFY